MARTSCADCGNDLSYSEPTLQKKGLKRLPDNMRCLRCIGSESCNVCGKALGTIGTVVGNRDNEYGRFCGSEICADCWVENQSGSCVKSVHDSASKEKSSDFIADASFFLIPSIIFIYLSNYFAPLFDGDLVASGFALALITWVLLFSTIVWIRISPSEEEESKAAGFGLLVAPIIGLIFNSIFML